MTVAEPQAGSATPQPRPTRNRPRFRQWGFGLEAVLAAALLAVSAVSVWRLNRGFPNVDAVLVSDVPAGAVLVDARGPLAYRRGHAPGARHLYARNLLTFRGAIGGQLAPHDEIVAALHRIGLHPHDTVVVYGDGSGLDAALVTLVLQVNGVNARVLRGGASSLGANRSSDVPRVTPSSASFTRNARLLVTAKDSLSHIAENAVAPLDVRSDSAYEKGHVANAVQMPPSAFWGAGRLPRYADFNAMLAAARLTGDTHPLVYSDDLRSAALAWLALTAYGISHVHVVSAPFASLEQAGASVTTTAASAAVSRRSQSLCWK